MQFVQMAEKTSDTDAAQAVLEKPDGGMAYAQAENLGGVLWLAVQHESGAVERWLLESREAQRLMRQVPEVKQLMDEAVQQHPGTAQAPTTPAGAPLTEDAVRRILEQVLAQPAQGHQAPGAPTTVQPVDTTPAGAPLPTSAGVSATEQAGPGRAGASAPVESAAPGPQVTGTTAPAEQTSTGEQGRIGNPPA